MMIAVNLRPGLKRKRAGSPLAGVLAGVKAFGSKVKDPALLVAVAAWIGVVGWLGYTWLTNTTELKALEPRLEQTRAEHKRFKTFLDQKHKQEQIRDSLLTQIITIRSVDGDRYVGMQQRLGRLGEARTEGPRMARARTEPRSPMTGRRPTRRPRPPTRRAAPCATRSPMRRRR